MCGQKYGPISSKLDNARRLRGIYFIDLDDEDYKATLQFAMRKLARPMAAAVLCKKTARTSNSKVGAEVIASQKVPKTIHGCKVESHELHHNLVHKFILMPQAMNIRHVKACSGQGVEETRNNPSVANGGSQEQRRFFWKHKEIKNKSTLLH